MLSIYQMQEDINQLNKENFINYLMDLRFLVREQRCLMCNHALVLVSRSRAIDSYAWRCMNRVCEDYKNYTSVRKGSFFECFKAEIKLILRIVLAYCMRQPIYSMNTGFDCCKNTILRVINKINDRIPIVDFSSNKLGGPGVIVQVDETMLNYKVKSHRGRSPRNKTDALCIVEVRGGITRCFATIIENKSQNTIVPIICQQVCSNSIIHTDEHGAYRNLREFFETHNTVCHKYSFINRTTGANTQAVESFHNELKLAIKRRKGVYTDNRDKFLKEFCFYYNNRNNFADAILNIIKD
ncbi:hypothetical protein DMUE_0398 [Dictyocoela muelleri]|nr:hypothetical protein DMUE_0398 [Dictyocoela muelleri]